MSLFVIVWAFVTMVALGVAPLFGAIMLGLSVLWFVINHYETKMDARAANDNS